MFNKRVRIGRTTCRNLYGTYRDFCRMYPDVCFTYLEGLKMSSLGLGTWREWFSLVQVLFTAIAGGYKQDCFKQKADAGSLF